jgi:hypothetical protein
MTTFDIFMLCVAILTPMLAWFLGMIFKNLFASIPESLIIIFRDASGKKVLTLTIKEDAEEKEIDDAIARLQHVAGVARSEEAAQ